MASQEDRWYEMAAQEVSEKNLVASVWARAFSEALGDTQLALALYIKLRVHQLEQDYCASHTLSRCDKCKAFVRPRKVARDFLVATFTGKSGRYFACPKCGSEIAPAPDQQSGRA
jgi:predicted RNA-binding Zn-ribbon protein involved in translation (DUF1610 family)